MSNSFLKVVEEHSIELKARKMLTPDSGIPSMWEVEATWQGVSKIAADQSLYYATTQALHLLDLDPMLEE